MHLLLRVFVPLLAAMLTGAALLHLIGKLGAPGRRAAEWLTRAPGVDLVIGWFTLFPWLYGIFVAGWGGLGVSIIAEIVALDAWIAAHEVLHPRERQGPRIVKELNHAVGWWQNHAALWVTAPGVPILWTVRVPEIFLYPLLTKLLRFPKYRQAEWVNVSRHKFDGLIGHDRIWCLYCDWMTGVWSLGTEILRNIETFWCPIRFYSEKKCENCRIDFPDIDGGWVPATATMAEVAETVREKHGHGKTSWFGHPERVQITVRGEPLDPVRV